MKKIMNQYKGNVLKAMMMLFAIALRSQALLHCLLVPLTTILSSPYQKMTILVS